MKNCICMTLFLITLHILSTSLKAQDSESEDLHSLNVIPKIEIVLVQGIGSAFEFPVGKSSILEVGAGLGIGYSNISNAETWVVDKPVVYAKGIYKLYYNRKKRLKKNKSISNNSGNYVGSRIKYASNELNTTNPNAIVNELQNVVLWDVRWGIQRTIYKRLLFSLSLGVGYGHNLDIDFTFPFYEGDISFAYKLRN